MNCFNCLRKEKDNSKPIDREERIQALVILCKWWQEAIDNLKENEIPNIHAAIFIAAELGNLDFLQAAREKEFDITDSVGLEDRRTALHWACCRGRVPVVSYLLDAGSNYDAQDKDGYTPLHLACQYGFFAIVLALVDRGASMEIPNKGGITALKYIRDPEFHAKYEEFLQDAMNRNAFVLK